MATALSVWDGRAAERIFKEIICGLETKRSPDYSYSNWQPYKAVKPLCYNLDDILVKEGRQNYL